MTEQEFIDQFINAPYAALPQPGPAPLPHVFMGDPSARFNPPPQLPSGGFLNPGMPFTSLGQFQGGLTQNQAYNQVTSGNPQVSPAAAAAAAASGSAPPSPSASNGPNNSLFSFSNPFYANVTSPKLNDQGNQIGTTPLNNRQFARPEMANALLRYFADTYGLKNGNIVTEQYAGGLGPSENELGIRFGNSNVLNAGLEYDRLQNRNGYSQQYLDAQFKDNLAPGSSGWNNYVTTGSMPGAMNSADAERAFAGNPATDPNVNAMGQAWKQAETGLNPAPQNTQPFNLFNTLPPNPPSYQNQSQNWSQNWRSFTGPSTASSYSNNLNSRRPYLPQNYRPMGNAAYTGRAPYRPASFSQRSTSGTPFGR